MCLYATSLSACTAAGPLRFTVNRILSLGLAPSTFRHACKCDRSVKTVDVNETSPYSQCLAISLSLVLPLSFEGRLLYASKVVLSPVSFHLWWSTDVEQIFLVLTSLPWVCDTCEGLYFIRPGIGSSCSAPNAQTQKRSSGVKTAACSLSTPAQFSTLTGL